MTFKVFQGSYSVNAGEQSFLKVAYHIIFMIDELQVLWLPSFIALGICFLCGTRFSWNEETDTCFNVECVLLGRNFDFLGGYCSLPNGYYWLVVLPGGYCSLPNGYYWLLLVTWWLLLVTGGYFSLPLVLTSSMNEYHEISFEIKHTIKHNFRLKLGKS